MPFTPAHISQARGQSTTTLLPTKDLIRIRQLYLARKYKPCISACESLAESTLHPIHQVFLLFQQAVCWEALGIAAHDFSSNKIPFFESAKEKLDSALEVLPEPFSTTEYGYCPSPKPSPLPLLHTPQAYDSSYYDPEPEYSPIRNSAASLHPRTPSFDDSSDGSDLSEVDRHDATCIGKPTAPVQTDFDARPLPPITEVSGKNETAAENDAARMKDDVKSNSTTNMMRDSNELQSVSPLSEAQQQCPTEPNSKDFLSASHNSDLSLVPSPLFSRKPKSARLFSALTRTVSGQLPNHGSGYTKPVQAGGRSPVPLSTPGPLRPLRHNTDHHNTPSQTSNRQTAISTLIWKFDRKLPSPRTPSSYTTCIPVASIATASFPTYTPATMRFNLISAAFSPLPLAEELQAYLSSHSLARYNESLADFRTSLHTSLTFINDRIAEASELQAKRKQQKQVINAKQNNTSLNPPPGQGMGKRLASYWLLPPPSSPSPAPSKTSASAPIHSETTSSRLPSVPITNSNTDHHQHRPLPHHTPRHPPHHQSNIKTTKTLEPQPRFNRRGNLVPTESAEKRQARLEKLRASGFVVRKEKYGFKGVEYYEEFRGRVEREMGVGGEGGG